MGMFSTVINSCQALGSELTGTLQSKDLESLMDTYWLSPDGQLYLVDDSATWTFRQDIDWSEPSSVIGGATTATGKKGRVRPYRIYGKVRFTDGPREAVCWFENGLLKQVLCRGPAFSCERVDIDAEAP